MILIVGTMTVPGIVILVASAIMDRGLILVFDAAVHTEVLCRFSINAQAYPLFSRTLAISLPISGRFRHGAILVGYIAQAGIAIPFEARPFLQFLHITFHIFEPYIHILQLSCKFLFQLLHGTFISRAGRIVFGQCLAYDFGHLITVHEFCALERTIAVSFQHAILGEHGDGIIGPMAFRQVLEGILCGKGRGADGRSCQNSGNKSGFLHDNSS